MAMSPANLQDKQHELFKEQVEIAEQYIDELLIKNFVKGQPYSLYMTSRHMEARHLPHIVWNKLIANAIVEKYTKFGWHVTYNQNNEWLTFMERADTQ